MAGDISLQIDQQQSSIETNQRPEINLDHQIRPTMPSLSSGNHRPLSSPANRSCGGPLFDAFKKIVTIFCYSCFSTYSFIIFSLEFSIQIMFFYFYSANNTLASIYTLVYYASCTIGYISELIWLMASLCVFQKIVLPLKVFHIFGLVYGEVIPMGVLFANIVYTNDCVHLAVMVNFLIWFFLLYSIVATLCKAVQAPIVFGRWKSILDSTFGEQSTRTQQATQTTNGCFYFVTAILALLPICLSGSILALLWNPNSLARATGCSQFQFRIDKVLSYPMVNISDANSTWSVIHVESAHNSTVSETIEGGTFLVADKHRMSVECDKILAGGPSSMGLNLNADNCTVIVAIFISDQDFKPEFNIMMNITAANESPRCLTATQPHFAHSTLSPNFTMDQTDWGSGETMGKRLESVCGGEKVNRQSIGKCADDKTRSVLEGMVPKVDCFRRCYSWIEHWPQGAIVKEHVRAEVISGGRKMEMRYNSKLGIPCED